MNKKLLFGSVLLAISLTMLACRLSSNGVAGAESGSSESTTTPPLVQPTSQAGAGQQSGASGPTIVSPSQPTSQPSVIQPNATPATVDQSVDQIDQDLNHLIGTSQASDLTLPTTSAVATSSDDLDQSMNNLQQSLQTEATP